METLVSNNGGQATTDSLRIAAKFGKRHDHVLRDIRKIIESDNFLTNPKLGELYFIKLEYKDLKGEDRDYYIISKKGFTILAMGFTGQKAFNFKIEYIEAFEKIENELKRIQSTGAYLEKHTKRPIQITNSKEVNHFNYSLGGKESAMEYNKTNCRIHTGLMPNQVVEQAKRDGIPSKNRTSAKEVFRYQHPEIAASMSLTDEFCKTGKMSVEDAAALCKDNALPLFAKMNEFGMLGM